MKTKANEDPMRYIENAKTILSEKAGKQGKFYSDPKYVKMACNTAWNGVLIAVDIKMKQAGFNFPAKGRMDVSIYRDFLGKRNQTMLKHFNSAYNYLHLLGGYDGDLNVATSKEGLELALKIINWANGK